MAEEDKIKISGQYLLYSPPGEFNDVFNDIRVLINNDTLLQKGILPYFEQYNTEQFAPVDLPGQSHKVIICKAGQIDSTHYVDPRSNQVFTFDHMRQVASDPQPHSGDTSSTRKALDDAFQEYINDHFPTGSTCVFANGNKFTVAIVANKYNPRNYWNGRWRSHWTIDVSGNSATCKGILRAQVHYYEDGNVQLNTEKNVDLQVSGSNIAAEIVKGVKKAEIEYQTALNESYGQLSDTTFKALRRALPITRNRLDWSKILHFRIGSELSQK